MNDINKHPVAFIAKLLSIYPEIDHVELSVFTYKPKSVKDKRHVVRIPASLMLSEYGGLVHNLSMKEEIAFNSRVYIRQGLDEDIRHIPMIDFKGELSLHSIKDVKCILRDFNCAGAGIFFSGRSYHLYGIGLLSFEKWVKFMGRILLLNLHKGQEVVDCRWVGHRLLSGYSALRLTNNTKWYKQTPEMVSLINLNDEVEGIIHCIYNKELNTESKHITDARVSD